MPEGKAIHPRKIKYENTLLNALANYRKIFLICVDNVGSKQMSDTRHKLRGKAQILMGKNTVIRKLLRREAKADPGLSTMLPKIRGNIGFIFTNEDLNEIREIVLEHKDPAPAKAGQIAPCDVWIEAGGTGLDPGMTGFFQALNIATKINRGAVEIIARVKMVVEGEKVSSSASSVLSKLKMKPFTFGIKVNYVYENGSCYDAKVLDLSEEDIMRMFVGSLVQASSLSLGLGYPSMASVPHLLSTAVRKLIAFSIATSYDIEAAVPYKKFLGLPVAGGAAKAEEKEAEDAGDDDDDDDDDDDEE